MVEFVAFEHTPKNIMIRAVKNDKISRKARLNEVELIMREFDLKPTLYNLLKGSNHI
jgi:hypothetical protein